MTMEHLTNAFNETEDYDGTYLQGVVIDIDDPQGLERVKAIIPGIYDTADDCQWIGPAKKSPFGQGPGFGSFGVPAVGSILFVELQDEDPHYPVYHGCLLTAACKDPAMKALFHKRAWGFRDPDGNLFVIDLDAHTTKFISQSKVSIVIDAQGTMTVNTPLDTNIVAGGNLNATVTGSLVASVNGSMNASVQGDASISAAGVTKVSGSQVQLNGS